MFNYVYMKILESQPDRYDRGIWWLSFGQSETVKRRIVGEQVTPGSRVLDMGCGTGTLAVLAAEKGAQVTGFDVSPGMLAVARRKVVAGGLTERIELQEGCVTCAGKGALSDSQSLTIERATYAQARFGHHVRVNHRRADIAVAEQFPDASEQDRIGWRAQTSCVEKHVKKTVAHRWSSA